MIDIEKLKEIRKLVIISMFSDDDLMDKFVLKGGSAIELIYKIDSRASVDVDLSLHQDFSNDELSIIIDKIKHSLKTTFNAAGYLIFDFNFTKRPHKNLPEELFFWGGYQIEFKITNKEQKQLLEKDIEKARKTAQIVNVNNGKKFTIDISKYEYCEEKLEAELDGYIIYVYTPEMLILEKLRAICQQMGEYFINQNYNKKPRPKDFYDIYTIIKTLNLEITEYHFELLKKIFEIKKVPLGLLRKIKDYKDFFESNLESLKSTIPPNRLKDFDFDLYFYFVLDLIDEIINPNELNQSKFLG